MGFGVFWFVCFVWQMAKYYTPFYAGFGNRGTDAIAYRFEPPTICAFIPTRAVHVKPNIQSYTHC
eukprot:COSAG05_NODE_438_length_9828_cov_4.712201_11_plen_65_part_00